MLGIGRDVSIKGAYIQNMSETGYALSLKI